MDLTSLQLPQGIEQQERADAYQQLLAEGAVMHCAGTAAHEALELLFLTVTTPGLGSLAAQVIGLVCVRA